MKKSIPVWQMWGFIFTGILGTMLHFLFDLSGENAVVGLFSAVNESIWEHIKLLFYPMVLFAILQYRLWCREVKFFWCIKLVGILVGTAIIPVLYYTYTGILGVSADWFNITIFFIAAGVACWLETKLFQKENLIKCKGKFAVLILMLMAVVFSVLTFWPPRIPLFQDPITGTYGFQTSIPS